MPCELLFFKDNPHDFINECNKTGLAGLGGAVKDIRFPLTATAQTQ